jgi:hypothetical protein
MVQTGTGESETGKQSKRIETELDGSEGGERGGVQ